MEPVKALALTLAGFGIAGTLLALRGGRRRASALGHALLALLLLSSSALLWMLGDSLGAYEIARHRLPVAELHFEQLGDARFRVTLTRLPGGRMQVFDIDGTAWRLDAKTLTWRGWGASLGFEPRYQLDRLTGLSRVAAAGTDAPEPASTFDLGSHQGLAIWQRARMNRRLQQILEAKYVFGPDVPISSGARYTVKLTADGLEARPANDAAVTLATSAP